MVCDGLDAFAEGYRRGLGTAEIHALSRVDPWFLENIRQIVDMRSRLMEMAKQGLSPKDWDADLLKEVKEYGFSDVHLGRLFRAEEEGIRRIRKTGGVEPVYKLVDTCAAEFEAYTPYYYSTYETECEARPSRRRKVVILGGGPNRIGQGIEFDYCCVHAAFALRDAGFETIMVNSNPETVSTDYDTSDKLYCHTYSATTQQVRNAFNTAMGRELLDLWTGWHAIGPALRPKYERFVVLANEGAKELGFADYVAQGERILKGLKIASKGDYVLLLSGQGIQAQPTNSIVVHRVR